MKATTADLDQMGWCVHIVNTTVNTTIITTIDTNYGISYFGSVVAVDIITIITPTIYY